jgi:hypothetical protein
MLHILEPFGIFECQGPRVSKLISKVERLV